LTRLANPFANSIRSISWNHGGTQALLVGASGGMFLFQSSTGQISQISSGTTAYLYSSVWSPNGLYALVAGERGIVLRYNATSVIALNTAGLYDPTAIIHAISWNPSGTAALLVGDQGVVLTYDGNQLTRVQSNSPSNLYAISWLGSTAYLAGGSGPTLTYTGGVVSALANNTGASLRGWAWRPS
jgi:WD40 repeat protein